MSFSLKQLFSRPPSIKWGLIGKGERAVQLYNVFTRLLGLADVKLSEKKLNAQFAVVVANQAVGRDLFFPGLDDVPFYTTPTLWKMRKLPSQLLVVGEGDMAKELVLAFAAKDVQVKWVVGDEVVPGLPTTVTLLSQTRVKSFEGLSGKNLCLGERLGEDLYIEFDTVLLV